MEITTKKIIKILPLDEAFKMQLLAEYDNLPLDKRFAIEQIAWDIYDTYVMMRIDENIQLTLRNAQTEEKGIINPDLYDKIKEETEKDIMEKGIAVSEKIDLQSARAQLASIIDPNTSTSN